MLPKKDVHTKKDLSKKGRIKQGVDSLLRKPIIRGVRPRQIKKEMKISITTPPAAGPGNFPNLLYRGGPVINNPQVYIIFLGDWTSTANKNRATRLQQFVSDLLNSSYMNILSQYGCGSTGNVVNSVFISNTNNNLLDSDVQTVLQNAINSNTIPEPTNKSNVYIVYLDDNTGIDDTNTGTILCEAIGDTGFGYHSFFNTTAGNPFYYAIVPGLNDICLQNTCGIPIAADCNLQLTETQEQRQTIVTSHELSEMITDPQTDGFMATSNLAWFDIDQNTGEIGDICAGAGNISTITVGSNTWTVQLMYSKWDDMQTNGVTTCVASEPYPLPSLLPACYLILERSTFGKDEVDAMLQTATGALFQDALYVVVEGFTPDELQLNSTNLQNPLIIPTFSGAFFNLPNLQINFDTSTGVQLEDSSNYNTIQRITFPFNIHFTQDTAFNNIPTNPGYRYLGLTATVAITANGTYPSLTVSENAQLEIVLQGDPFMMAGETFWLSNDIRVFQVTPAALGSNQAPLQNSTTLYPSGSTNPNNTYIQNLINELNLYYNTNPTSQTHPFDLISSLEAQSALELNQNNTNGQAVFNFALVRVRLVGDIANNVRIFFRLFISSSPDTNYDQNTTYRRATYTDNSGNNVAVPLLGFPTNDMSTTIPFFAVSRVNSSTTSMTSQPADTPNVQTIPNPSLTNPPSTGQSAYAYFGCWLDINQPTPQFPVDPTKASTTDGPWNSSEVLPIPSLIMGNHACLVAEISYDPDPIPSGASTATSDKLGQRNLSWVSSDNPGPADSHRVPTTFDIRPTNPKLVDDSMPDELMIDWGNTPVGSTASIYWPQIDADQILQLADKLYTVKTLRKSDKNTIQCITGKITYIPIPSGIGPNFAGLITVDLPSTITTGQQFKIVVRRISSRSFEGVIAAKANSKKWRYVVGAFQINIPVSTSHILLKPEENLLAVFKWKIETLPKINRWYPVLERYIEQISARVNAFGGNASQVGPSLGGTGYRGKRIEEHIEYTGKVEGLIYDRFADFEGFLFLTKSGDKISFRSKEREMEELVRMAWSQRMLISVFVNPQDQHLPLSIILRRVPQH